jgi:ribonuclease E
LGGVNGANGNPEPRPGGTYTNIEPEDVIDTEPELPAPVSEVISLPTITKQNTWIERGERSKPSKPEPIKPVVEPPEVVYVEMTPEEQDIYALMGISPMVRLDREVKNTKSVIVKVIAPGEQPTPETEASIPQLERQQIEYTPTPIRESIPVRQRIAKPELPEPEIELDDVLPEPEPEPEPESEPEPEPLVQNTSVETSSAAVAEASSAVAEEDMRRRRRRRSSAMDNGM